MLLLAIIKKMDGHTLNPAHCSLRPSSNVKIFMCRYNANALAKYFELGLTYWIKQLKFVCICYLDAVYTVPDEFGTVDINLHDPPV